MRKASGNRFFIILIFAFFLKGNLYSQSEDFNLWTGIEIEKEVIKNFKLGLEVSNRLMDNLNQRDESLLDFGLNYDIKDLSLSVVYRLSNKNEGGDNFSYSNRFSTGINYKFEIARFRTDLRLRYQKQYDAWHSSEFGYIPDNLLRSRVKIRYDIRRIPVDPFVSYESFQGLDNSNLWLQEKQRITFGVKYIINNKNSLDILFHKQTEKNISSPSDKSIISLSYGLEL